MPEWEDDEFVTPLWDDAQPEPANHINANESWRIRACCSWREAHYYCTEFDRRGAQRILICPANRKGAYRLGQGGCAPAQPLLLEWLERELAINLTTLSTVGRVKRHKEQGLPYEEVFRALRLRSYTIDVDGTVTVRDIPKFVHP